MKDFRVWMEDHRNGLNGWLCTPMVLQSGLRISVQASHLHYCEPSKDMGSYTEYTAFEIGFPSEVIEDLLPYAYDPEDPTDTVYAYVPFEVIQKVIEDHGGIK